MTESASAHKPQSVESATLATAFTAVYEQSFDYVWHSLRRLGVAERDLEDVTQEVFVIVHRKLDQYDASLPLKPWLFGIAVRTAANFRRLSRHGKEVSQDRSEIDGQEPDQDKALQSRQIRELLIAALQKVVLERRALIILHDIDGCSMPEISTSMNIPLNTAYSRLRLGREELAQALGALRAKEAI